CIRDRSNDARLGKLEYRLTRLFEGNRRTAARRELMQDGAGARPSAASKGAAEAADSDAEPVNTTDLDITLSSVPGPLASQI
ncbi:MAG: hypothetical protein AB9M60_19825, partial [Leptothrix sp. (in: b-proteobacteria)]